MGYFLLTLLMLVGIFLMMVILLQRGRGGGLAGAFGGLGGQSAFGTKAGDVFTVITVVTVVIWVTLACLAGARLNYEATNFFKERQGADEIEAAKEIDRDPRDTSAPAGETKEAPDSQKEKPTAPPKRDGADAAAGKKAAESSGVPAKAAGPRLPADEGTDEKPASPNGRENPLDKDGSSE